MAHRIAPGWLRNPTRIDGYKWHRTVTVTTLMALGFTGLAAIGAATAHAQESPTPVQACTNAGGSATTAESGWIVTCTFTPGNYTWTPAPGTGAATFEVWGAQGQNSSNSTSNAGPQGFGGKGGYVQGTAYNLSSDLSLSITAGSSGGSFGYGGPGAGSPGQNSLPAGGGGGASSVIGPNSVFQLWAGGGGGAGQLGNSGGLLIFPEGGAGGYGGQTGPPISGSAGSGGSGGNLASSGIFGTTSTISNGGSGGAGGSETGPGTQGGNPGEGHLGGPAQTAPAAGQGGAAGGGGGGGWYGGAGGGEGTPGCANSDCGSADGGGGGGGSNYLTTQNLVNTTSQQAVQSGNGLVKVITTDPGSCTIDNAYGITFTNSPPSTLPSNSTYCTNAYMLTMQSDGNLVEYSASGAPIWASATNQASGAPGAYAIMQGDGNFVIYNTSGQALWATGTNNSSDGTQPASTFSLEVNGNLVMTSANGNQVWSSQNVFTAGQVLSSGEQWLAANGTYELRMQPDGNLVEAKNPFTTDSLVWAAGTNLHNGASEAGAYAIMQDDGNLVIYNTSGLALWASNTYGNPGAYFAFQGDANLVVYSSAGKPLWASNTAGG
jgi:hypothetical protein